jgi:hypothetical protein
MVYLQYLWELNFVIINRIRERTVTRILRHVILRDVATSLALQPHSITHDFGSFGPTGDIESLLEVVEQLIRT